MFCGSDLWMILRDEIKIFDKVFGIGVWGRVMEGDKFKIFEYCFN